MVVVPAGRFMMGSPASEPGRYDREGPRHLVTIANPFAVGKYEVTRTEFGRFASASGRQMKGCIYRDGKEFPFDIARNWEKPGFPQRANEPALCVSWEDAQAYVRWLSEQSGKTYRLLSEAQWEYAARAGSDEARSWEAEQIELVSSPMSTMRREKRNTTSDFRTSAAMMGMQ